MRRSLAVVLGLASIAAIACGWAISGIILDHNPQGEFCDWVEGSRGEDLYCNLTWDYFSMVGITAAIAFTVTALFALAVSLLFHRGIR